MSIDIDAKLEAAAERVAQTLAAMKRLLDIIAKITREEVTIAKSPSTTTLQPPAKSPSTTTKTTSKHRGATSGGAVTPKEPEHKHTRSTESTPAATADTPSTSPIPRQKKQKSIGTPQGSSKDRLRSAKKNV